METAWAFALVHFSYIDPIYWVLWIARLHCRKAWTGLCLLTRAYISPAIDTYIYLPILPLTLSLSLSFPIVFIYIHPSSTVFLERPKKGAEGVIRVRAAIWTKNMSILGRIIKQDFFFQRGHDNGRPRGCLNWILPSTGKRSFRSRKERTGPLYLA